MKLINIITKNLKLLLNAKGSALIILLGPLLIIFLVGIAFGSSNAFNINLGVYSESYSELTNSYVDSLGDKQFSVKKYEEEDFCIDEIKKGRLQACVVFPPDMEINTDVINEVVFHVDYSKINIVWVILESINKKLGSKTEEYSKELTQVLIDKLKETQQELNDKSDLLVTIKSESSEIVSRIESSSGNLDSVSLDVDVNTLKIPGLAEKNSALSTEINNIENNTLGKVNDVVSQLNSIKSELETINSSNLNIAISLTNSAIDNIDEIKNRLENTINSTEKISADFDVLIGELQSNVNSIEENTNKFSDAKTSLSSSLTDTKQKIDSMLNNIIEIQKSFYKIDDNIKSIQVTDVSKIVSPITTRIEPITNENTQLNYMFPSLVMLVIMFVSILLSSTLVIMEKNSKAYFRNFITPTRDITFIIATFLTAMIIMLFQVIIVVLIAWLFFKIQILATLLATSVVLLIATGFFVLLGMLIGYIFKSEETATLAAVSVSAIFLLLSSVILPIEGMSENVQKAAKFNPFVISESLLKQSLLFKEDIMVQSQDILFLGAYAMLIFGIILIGHQVLKKNFIKRYSLKLMNITRSKDKKTDKKDKDKKKKEQPPNIKIEF